MFMLLLMLFVHDVYNKVECRSVRMHTCEMERPLNMNQGEEKELKTKQK